MSDIGIWGLGVMGQNLALNFANNGYKVSVYNRSEDGEENIVPDFISSIDKDKAILGFTDISEFIDSLDNTKIILIMVKAGNILDRVIETIIPYLSKDDIIIDGGNSDYKDTARRVEKLSTFQINYIGCGISGGSEGALNGPSMMPGGNFNAWEKIESMFQKISAKDKESNPCCQWMGLGGAGHFVKTLHNGIEYSIMQIIAEIYDIQKKALNFDNEKISENFGKWQTQDLKNYLFEITSKLINLKDKNNKYVLDSILDKSAQKGTGINSVIASFDYGVPVPPIVEAVNARLMSSFYSNRKKIDGLFATKNSFNTNSSKMEDDLYDGIYLAILLSYINGMELIKESSIKNRWNIELKNIINVWKSGCIIQSNILYFLEEIVDEFDYNDTLFNNPMIIKEINSKTKSLRNIVINGISSNVPVSGLYAVLSIIDNLNTDVLPANLIQIQRDFFGYHGFEKVNKDGKIYHLDMEI